MDTLNIRNLNVKACNEQIFCEFHDGEVVILNLRDGVYYGLNPVGARIWQLVQQPISFEEIIQVILSEYNVERQQSEADLLELLQDLKNHHLVEFVNEELA